MRRVLVFLVILLTAYIVGRFVYQTFEYAKVPVWKRQLQGIKKLDIVESSPLSVQYQNDANRITHDLMLAENWTASEVEELLGFIDISSIRDEQVVTGSEFDTALLEIWLRRSDALTVISERFRVGGPIDDDQTQHLIDRLTEGLYQTVSPRYFGAAVANVTRSGLADTPGPIRDRILLIYAYPKEFFGPHGEMAAENIKRQLKSRGTFVLEGETHGG